MNTEEMISQVVYASDAQGRIAKAFHAALRTIDRLEEQNKALADALEDLVLASVHAGPEMAKVLDYACSALRLVGRSHHV